MTSRLKMIALSVTGGGGSSSYKDDNSDYYSVLYYLLNKVLDSRSRASVTGAHGAMNGVCLLRTGYMMVVAHLVRKLMVAGVDDVASSAASSASSSSTGGTGSTGEAGGCTIYIGDSGETGLGANELQWLVPRLLALVGFRNEKRLLQE